MEGRYEGEDTCPKANGMWDLVYTIAMNSVVSCRWVFSIKFLPDGNIEYLKARLVGKGYI